MSLAPCCFNPQYFSSGLSSHFIEHCDLWKAAIGLWWSKIKVGGHLVLYWPHPDLYPKKGQPGANRKAPQHQNGSPREVRTGTHEVHASRSVHEKHGLCRFWSTVETIPRAAKNIQPPGVD